MFKIMKNKIFQQAIRLSTKLAIVLFYAGILALCGMNFQFAVILVGGWCFMMNER